MPADDARRFAETRFDAPAASLDSIRFRVLVLFHLLPSPHALVLLFPVRLRDLLHELREHLAHPGENPFGRQPGAEAEQRARVRIEISRSTGGEQSADSPNQ